MIKNGLLSGISDNSDGIMDITPMKLIVLLEDQWLAGDNYSDDAKAERYKLKELLLEKGAKPLNPK